MRNRLLSLCLLVFSIIGSVQGQGDLATILAEYDITVKDKGDDVIKDTYAVIRPRMAALSVDQQKELAGLFEKMKEARLSFNPYYKSFFLAYAAVANPDLPSSTYDEWIAVLQSMLGAEQSNRANKVKDYLSFSQDYFSDGSFNKSKGGTNWRTLTYHDELGFKADKPFLKYTKTDLLAFTKKDSMMISSTSGSFLPLQGLWQGSGGGAEWDEGEMGPISAEFKGYTVEIKKGIYNVKEAYLTFEQFFGTKTIKGSFQDKLSNESVKQHPVFVSEATDLVINDLGENLSLTGGLKLAGQRPYSTGKKGNLAAMKLKDASGNTKFKLGSKLFGIQKSDEISGKNMSVALYFGQDSIFHPSVNVKYDPVENSLRLLKGERALDAVPFFDSYHNFNIDVDEIKWYINQDSLIFGEEKKGITSEIKALYFESPDYFSKKQFIQAQSTGNVNPIIILKIMSEKDGTKSHSADAVAKRINPKYNAANSKPLFYELVAGGFIDYDEDEQIIDVREKVFHFADASRDRIDYDRLRITSKTSSNNATTNTKTNVMTVANVKGVEVSPSHRVAMVPIDKALRIMKDRSLGIDGNVYAGLSSFEGTGLNFNYDQFLMKMDSVRFMDFFVPPSDGSKEPVGLSSRLENGNGTLLIDAPGNKSGQEKIPLFPSFTSDRPFSVFYDRAQGGAYDREHFYFLLDKFGFNSLDSFSMSDVQFKGKLHSQDIFAPFDETVAVQEEDYSLGFNSETAASGRSLYKGKGTFTGTVTLNNQGLLGKGKVDYLESVLEAEDIVFRPELLTGTSKALNIEASSTVPSATGTDVLVKWIPYRDSMIYQSQETPFELYGADKATLTGLLHLSPKGLSGSGSMNFDLGVLTSDRFELNSNSAKTDTSDLKIMAGEGDEVAFNTKNVAGEIDFNQQVAKFKANSSDISTEMPYNKYKTSMNEFVWDIPNKTVSFTAKGNDDAYFLSTDAAQDSLIFAGKTAVYNIAESTLEVKGVSQIEVGDAIIETANGEVRIASGGAMNQLSDATIYVDRTTKQHQINKATVDILSLHSYTAKGEYAYDLSDKKQSVLLNNVVGKLNGKGKVTEQISITKASGEITEDENFYIDERTKFSGSMSLSGDSKDLMFKGYAQLDAPLLQNKAWFSINSLGDKNDLSIAYDVPKDKDGAQIRTGIYISKESALAYPSVMYPLSFRKDRSIIGVKGQFKYDKAEETFVFGDSLKLAGGSMKGNILKYNNATAEVFAEGELNMCPNIRNIIPMKTVGRIATKYKTKTSDQLWSDIAEPEVKAFVMSSISLPIPKSMMDQMAVDFRSSTYDATKPEYSKDDFYHYALSEFSKKKKEYDKAMSNLAINTIDIPKAQDKSSFILGKMEMKWDPDYQSFVSKPGKVALVSVNGSAINIMIDVHIEYKMTTNDDDRLYIYLKSPSGSYYFYGLQGEVFNITSDNARFMKPLNEMKDKDRIIDITKELSIEIQAVTEATSNKFIQRAKAAW